MVDREEIVNALHTVEDPELGMDIVELGLFYDVEIAGPKVKVIDTLTSMGCPAGPMIQEDIHERDATRRGRRGGRGRADVRPSVDAGQDVRRRQVHSWLWLAVYAPHRASRVHNGYRSVESLRRPRRAHVRLVAGRRPEWIDAAAAGVPGAAGPQLQADSTNGNPSPNPNPNPNPRLRLASRRLNPLRCSRSPKPLRKSQPTSMAGADSAAVSRRRERTLDSRSARPRSRRVGQSNRA